LGLNGRVRLLATRTDVPALLAACDVFALTSLTEAASMIILEAMAAGVPAVATKVGGNGELLVEGQTGLLVPTGDVRTVGDALTRLLDDRELARAMEEAAGGESWNSSRGPPCSRPTGKSTTRGLGGEAADPRDASA
jgi:glycosyltransferase involved in cell wall biosynthesis